MTFAFCAEEDDLEKVAPTVDALFRTLLKAKGS